MPAFLAAPLQAASVSEATQESSQIYIKHQVRTGTQSRRN
ncbi:Uncharacterised protein [Bordetella pertussis]|nr:Uncharacterised protein [Bordetella pertussis]CFW43594.1 Uncharacterised protein [Bordetella pertussis]